jgi:hypothetical protein
MSDVAAASASAPASLPPHVQTAWKSASGFGFRDIIDIVNPLQHLPIIGSVYRYLTGDRPGEAAQLAGDALYGGPIGVGISVASAATEDDQGHDLGERALIAVFGSHDGGSATAVASAAHPAASQAASPAPLSTSQVAAAAQTAQASPAPAAMPMRQPMPLFGGIATPVPNMAAASAQPQTAAHAFEAHQAMLERSITAGRTGPVPTAPVPLVLPAGTLLSRVEPSPVRRSANAPTAPSPGTTATGTATAAPANASGASGAPAAGEAASAASGLPPNVSQKMLDALDKYMQLERAREKKDGTTPATGAALDLAL